MRPTGRHAKNHTAARALLSSLAAAVALGGIVLSCQGSSSDPLAGSANVEDAGPSADAAVSADTDAAARLDASQSPPPPRRARFGLDARPLNRTCKAPPRPTTNTGVKRVNAFPGLSFQAPTGMFQAPGDPFRFYVMERGGAVRTFRAGASSMADVADFVRLAPGVVNTAGEGGLLGMAFDPGWAQSRTAYLSYTTFAPGTSSNMRSVVARFTSNDAGATLTAQPEVIVEVAQPYTNHNGGGIGFGPDGLLYIGFGDGGSGGDPLGNGQDKGTLLGKILRIDVQGTAPRTYRIPPTNPFASGGGRGEIYALGFRNPWRWSFDRETGDLWVGDVGQGAWEEIDRVRLGGNYGWRYREGAHCYNPQTGCPTAGLIDPVAEHDRTEARSITGGYVYRGTAIAGLVGAYVYGDFETGNVWALQDDSASKPVPKLLLNVGPQLLASFAQDADGEIYLVTFDGSIGRLAASAPAAPSTFPDHLSATGCVDPADAKKPAAGLIPYEVNAPLWSDGAEKERFLALPEGGTITVGADGDWDLPAGTVLVKTFIAAGRRIETRLFVRHDDGGWAGYSYEWNDAQTDATLLPAGKTKLVGATSWSFPSRSQCMQCHTRAAGGSLGLETAQMNRETTYLSSNRIADQIATFEHIGLFAAPPVASPNALPRLADPAGAGPLEDRARAYLHANCAHCHMPEGGGRGTMDLRHTQPLAATQMCDAMPKEGELGIANARLVAPGAPERSLVSVRMHAADVTRMPPVGTHVRDAVGVEVVDSWIRALRGCP